VPDFNYFSMNILLPLPKMEKEILKVTLVQQDIVWEKPAQNRAKLNHMLSDIGETDVVILPEMFTTGFTMNPSPLAEPMDGETTRWMKAKAATLNAAVTGSLIIAENGEFKNRLVWVNPDGQTFSNDKRHLFSMGGEPQHYTRGQERLIVEFRGWRICPLVCYDLRFPVWSRNTENYDLLFYVANWPAPRQHVWKSLLVARAIENQAYCIGVNRSGTDGEGIAYEGGSCLCDAKGFATFIGVNQEAKTFALSLNELQAFRQKFPVLLDRDNFSFAE
jgi:predicted amidohydrolase